MRNYHNLARFTVTVAKDYRIEEVGIAPLKSMQEFRVMPRSALREPDRPAPHSLVADLRETAQRFPELRAQLENCETAHRVLSYHDVANLLLLQLGLRSAQSPQSASKIAAPGR